MNQREPLNWAIKPITYQLKLDWAISRSTSQEKVNYLVSIDGLAYGEIAPNLRYGESVEKIQQDINYFMKFSREMNSYEEFHLFFQNEFKKALMSNSVLAGIEMAIPGFDFEKLDYS